MSSNSSECNTLCVIIKYIVYIVDFVKYIYGSSVFLFGEGWLQIFCFTNITAGRCIFLKGQQVTIHKRPPVNCCFIGKFVTGFPVTMLLCFFFFFKPIVLYCTNANIYFYDICYEPNMFYGLFQTDPRHCKLDLQWADVGVLHQRVQGHLLAQRGVGTACQGPDWLWTHWN